MSYPRPSTARIVQRGNSVVVSHKELIGPIKSSIAYRINSYDINPGYATCFSWLEGVAAHYEEYKFRSLNFTFHSACGSTTIGQMAMAFEFDPGDALPADFAELVGFRDMKFISPYETAVTFTPDLRTGDRKPPRPVRNGGRPISEVMQTDLGRFYCATQGFAADAGIVGNLEVSYTVELLVQSLHPPISATASCVPENTSAPYNAAATLTTQSVMPLTISSTAAGSVIRFIENFEGVLHMLVGGTGLTREPRTGPVDAFTNGTLGLIAGTSVVNAATTSAASLFRVAARAGDAFNVYFNGGDCTTLTSAILRIAGGNFQSF